MTIGPIIGHISIRIYQRNSKQMEDHEHACGFGMDPGEAEARQMPVVLGLQMARACAWHVMLFGASVMFSRRSKDLGNCVDTYSPDDAVIPGNVFYQKDGDLYIGGPENYYVNYTALRL